jgi:hypothetical protein
MDVTLNNVASWIEELRQKAGDPVLLKIHERLRDSLELLPSRPILFLGEVSGRKAADRILLSTKRRMLWAMKPSGSSMIPMKSSAQSKG